MPTPKSGESEQDFVSRCMGYSDMQKYNIDQRTAICYNKFRSARKSDISKAKTVEGFESPEPGDIPEKEKDILARVYAEQRKKGMDKEQSAKIAWGAVNRYREANKSMDIQKSYNQIQSNLNSVRKSVAKAQEGDKKTIFGRPATFSSGKWVTDGGEDIKEETDEGSYGTPSEDQITTEDMSEFANIYLQDQEGIDSLKEDLFYSEGFRELLTETYEDALDEDIISDELDLLDVKSLVEYFAKFEPEAMRSYINEAKSMSVENSINKSYSKIKSNLTKVKKSLGGR